MVDLSSQYWIALRTDVIYHYFLKEPIIIGGCLIMGLWIYPYTVCIVVI